MYGLRLTATPETLDTVLAAVEECLSKEECPEGIKTEILIAVEEMYVNIVSYAYGGNEGEAIVQIEIISTPKACRIVLRDRGIPYNPLAKPDPDITLPAWERKIGGLGIYMVKKSMDHVEYRHEDGFNIFTMEKKLAVKA